MTDQSLIIAVAKLDEITFDALTGDVMVAPGRYEKPHPNHFKPYLTSRDAIIPVIEKQDFTEEQWEVFLRFCIPDEADWIACNKVWRDERFRLQQSRLPRAFRLLALLSAKQLSIALVKATGKWEE